jgi:splicing factor U2AF subunit
MRTVEEASNAMALDGIIYEVIAVVVSFTHFHFSSGTSSMRRHLTSLLLLLKMQGISVRVRRPSDYNPSMAATLGPSQPSSHMNLAAVGLAAG